jgi:hypothetical protein
MTDITGFGQDYGHWLVGSAQRIQFAQQRATLSVTREQALLYIRSFAGKWPKPEFVQQAVALLSLGKKPA